MKAVAWIAVLLCLSLTAKSQTILHSLDEAWALSERMNPGQHMHELAIDKATAERKKAGSAFLPKATAYFSGQQNFEIAETPVPGELMGQPGETVYLKFGQEFAFNSGLTLSKTLLDWQAGAQYRLAKLRENYAVADKELYAQLLREQTAQLYYASLVAAEAVALSRKDLTLADSLLQLAQQKKAAGLADELSLNLAILNRNNTAALLEENMRNQQQMETELKLLTGVSLSDTLRLTEKIADAMRLTMPQIAVPFNNKRTTMTELEARLYGAEVKQAAARFAPKIDLIYQVGVQQYKQEFGMSFHAGDWKGNSYLGLQVSVPLFTGFGNKENYSSAKIAHQTALEKHAESLLKSAADDTILKSNYGATFNRTKIFEANFRTMASNLQLAGIRYNEGLISLEDYLNYFNDYLDTEWKYLQSLSVLLTYKAITHARK